MQVKNRLWEGTALHVILYLGLQICCLKVCEKSGSICRVVEFLSRVLRSESSAAERAKLLLSVECLFPHLTKTHLSRIIHITAKQVTLLDKNSGSEPLSQPIPSTILVKRNKRYHNVDSLHKQSRTAFV